MTRKQKSKICFLSNPNVTKCFWNKFNMTRSRSSFNFRCAIGSDLRSFFAIDDLKNLNIIYIHSRPFFSWNLRKYNSFEGRGGVKFFWNDRNLIGKCITIRLRSLSDHWYAIDDLIAIFLLHILSNLISQSIKFAIWSLPD